MLPLPDCCDAPTLRALLVLSEDFDAEILLERCSNCSAFWRVTVQQRIKMNGAKDSPLHSFEPLSDHEADDLLFGS